MDFVARLMCITFLFCEQICPPGILFWVFKKALPTEMNENLPAFLLNLFYDVIKILLLFIN